MAGQTTKTLINEALRVDIAGSVLCWLATADASGRPNASPKEIFAALGDDRLVIADIASPVSVANITVNPQVCVSFIDIFRQRGFKVEGRAHLVERDDPRFAEVGAELLRMAGPDFPIRAVIVVEMEKVSRIWAPSYRLFPERSEAERMQAAFEAYGVEPKV
jgi:uncharacterized protein